MRAPTALWNPRRPAMVPVRLAELRIAEDFVTSLTGQRGVVVDWGFVVDEDASGRRVRVRAVKVRFGTVERVHSAELVVLVPFDRAHVRHEADDVRWGSPLKGASAEAVS